MNSAGYITTVSAVASKATVSAVTISNITIRTVTAFASIAACTTVAGNCIELRYCNDLLGFYSIRSVSAFSTLSAVSAICSGRSGCQTGSTIAAITAISTVEGERFLSIERNHKLLGIDCCFSGRSGITMDIRTISFSSNTSITAINRQRCIAQNNHVCIGCIDSYGILLCTDAVGRALADDINILRGLACIEREIRQVDVLQKDINRRQVALLDSDAKATIGLSASLQGKGVALAKHKALRRNSIQVFDSCVQRILGNGIILVIDTVIAVDDASAVIRSQRPQIRIGTCGIHLHASFQANVTNATCVVSKQTNVGEFAVLGFGERSDLQARDRIARTKQISRKGRFGRSDGHPILII